MCRNYHNKLETIQGKLRNKTCLPIGQANSETECQHSLLRTVFVKILKRLSFGLIADLSSILID